MIFIIIILFLILYLFIFSGSNPYTLTMIFGKKGCGKTSDIAKQSLYYIKKGYKVYSNVAISGTELYDPKNIGLNTFPPNSVVFCDEVGLIWNNRDFKTFQKCVREWFKYQRQYKIKMILYSQAFDIDKQLRDLTDNMYIMRRLGKISIKRPVYKKIGISKDGDGNGALVDTYSYGLLFSGWKFTYLPRYYGMFKSFNPPNLPIIKSTLIDYNDLSLIYADNKKYILYQLNLFKDYILVFLNNVKIWLIEKCNK